MKFRDLAWGAFAVRSTSYESAYQTMITDADFLARLQNEPSQADFEKIRWFLVNYGVHYARKNLAEQYSSIWPRLKPHIRRVANETLETCDLSGREIENEITAAYQCLDEVWGGDTVISKVLHFLNTRLFIMWDNPIQLEYKMHSSYGYIEFLKVMQRHAIEITEDFKGLSLPGTPAEYLSQQLGYSYMRPLTKLIDDYNWITITRSWPKSMPRWLLVLHSPPASSL